VEYIIIDGGSTDGTLDIIKKYEDYIDYWVSEPDKGIYDAWNKGVTVTNGKYVSFLGSGDTYHKDALSRYCNVILEDSLNCLYISSKIELKKDNKVIRIIGKKWDWKVFKKYMNVAHVGSLHSLKLFKTFGLFDINFKIAGDYEFLLRVKDKLKACFLNEITASMRIDGVSNNSIKVFFETYLAKRRHTNRNSLFLFWELVLGIIKWYIRRFVWRLKIY
jgi:glycosyltransferase involved in cell wall biosynthesis